jgi:aspartokinase-like uncharacterized kinase
VPEDRLSGIDATSIRIVVCPGGASFAAAIREMRS